jgi:glycine/D-amino acid oxidase-like deaminating enzyme
MFRVICVDFRRNQVQSITTNQGQIKCETIVNAAGAHAYHIAKVI